MDGEQGRVLCEWDCGTLFVLNKSRDIFEGKFFCSTCMPYIRNCRDCGEICKAQQSRHIKSLCGTCRDKRVLTGKGTHSWYSLRFKILMRDGFTCRYCGRTPLEDKTRLELDHIIPRVSGGSNGADNLITSCSACNGGKKDVILEQRLELKIRERKIYEL